MTRDGICQNCGLDRRRLSSAVSPLCAIGLLVEPEAMKIGSGIRLIKRERMPGVRLFRNSR